MVWPLRPCGAGFRVGLACAGLAVCAPDAAQASFAVCNQSFDVVNVAIGQDAGGTFETEGWWTIGPNQCAQVIRDDLVNRYIYVFAMDVFEQPLLSGGVPMCVDMPFPDPSRKIAGIEDCWANGYREALFFEVDTQDQARWTLFLNPDPEG